MYHCAKCAIILTFEAMRVLILSHRVPYPNTDGGAIVANAFIDALQAHHVQVDMLSFNTTKHFLSPEIMKQHVQTKYTCHEVPLDNAVKPLPALVNLLFTNTSYNYARFNDDVFTKKLITLLQENNFDIVHLENMYMGHYIKTIRQFSTAKITIRIHNIEHKIWQKLAIKSTGIKAWYLNKMSARLYKEEIHVLNSCDFLFGLQTGELKEIEQLGVHTKSALVPFSIKIPQQDIAIKALPHSFFHIASMDWLPNQEAVLWFVQNVWPKILEAQPNATLHLAGKNMPDKITQLQSSSITVHGAVPNQYTFMQQYDTMIVPLLSGAGIRVKVIEALALGKKIVSTTLGVEGIAIAQLQNVQIADDANSFAHKCLISINSENIENTENSINFIRDNYSETEVANDLYKYLSLLMHGKA
jgi:polysaccharide biosynthesis protein PslH